MLTNFKIRFFDLNQAFTIIMIEVFGQSYKSHVVLLALEAKLCLESYVWNEFLFLE